MPNPAITRPPVMWSSVANSSAFDGYILFIVSDLWPDLAAMGAVRAAARDSFSNGLGMLVQAVGNPDMREGATAFLEKRAPSFPPPA